jgi:abequosyltransferase
MTPVRLSICMPTYNFGAFIAETLDSIVPQLRPEVEIVILDGGSTDDTEAAVLPFAREHPQISYIRQAQRGGIDRDMARCVELARGEYCWLFSSDDVMKPGALQRVLSEIGSSLDIYLCGLTLCDKGMKPIVDHTVSNAAWGSIFDLGVATERARYFELAQTTTAIFSFMGSIIFRRSRWQEQLLAESYVGSCWAHVVRILRMIPDGLTVKFLGESLQLKRGENDSFMDKGVVHRFAIAIDGYHRIAAEIFGERSIEAAHVRRVIAIEFPLKAMLLARVQCREQGRMAEIPELDRLVAKTYGDHTLRNSLRRAGYHLVGNTAFKLARGTYRTLRRFGLVPSRK